MVGINVDVLLEKYHTIGQQYIIYPQETIDQFISTLKDDIQNADYLKEIEDGILQFIEDIITKIVIKAHPEKNLHAKSIYSDLKNSINIQQEVLLQVHQI